MTVRTCGADFTSSALKRRGVPPYIGQRVGAPRWLADEGEVQRILQRRIGGRLKTGSSGNKLSEGELALCRRVNDRAGFGMTFGAGNIPLSNSRGDQHFASGSAGFAQIAVRIANAAAASSQLLAIFWVEVGLHDLNAAPIAAELLRHDHRERCANALPHFGFAAPDFYVAVAG